MRLLLISNAKRDGTGYLEHAAGEVADFLPDDVERLLFVPFAAVTRSADEYLDLVRPVFAATGREIIGIHDAADQVAAVERAEAIVVGGGNTWELLRRVRQRHLLEPIRERVRGGVPYVGWSAGANLACPTIMTTNDMPIVQPGPLDALDLVPFQINPHYLHGNPPGFHGETRETRIAEFCALHRGVWVAGLHEGAMLRVDGDRLELRGDAPCRVFRWGVESFEVAPGGDVSFLARRRIEHDSLGEREVPHHAYYGVQTVRALENFPLSRIQLSMFPSLITAFAQVKQAAAITNGELGGLDPARRDAIVKACEEVASGEHSDHFVVDMLQGGAGTSTNMNVNEVITNRGLELLGHERGDYEHLHPIDDTNRSQSTNDAYPTALKLAIMTAADEATTGLEHLQAALVERSQAFAHVIKMGRTELQDAVPMTLGQEFAAYAVMVGEGVRALRHSVDDLHSVALGATAIGTGITSPPGYAARVTEILAELSDRPLTLAHDLVEATQDSGDFVSVSAAMKRAAVQVSKIANDLRLLSSGPRAGLAEIRLPAMQPGSSIMPGKVNPVIPEVVNVVCYQLIGFDVAVTMAAEASQLELNHTEPLMALDVLHGLHILGRACRVLADRCVAGIEADEDRCRRYVERSTGVVTALNPVIGYERSAMVAKEALATGRPVTELVVEHGWLTAEQVSDLLRPERLVNPLTVED
ncbi:dipeptidase PepE [Intrasporangium oryzae]|uniref:dipeptidase PepE n=1 Tax=Intrasporangium oryzae TaxID=412687 RepID=UPI0012FC8323|nr:dipeptidase PepE [Intrasporangium oryzae]